MNLPVNAGETGSVLGQEDLLDEELATHSDILAWKNSMDREAWLATVHWVAKSQT